MTGMLSPFVAILLAAVSVVPQEGTRGVAGIAAAQQRIDREFKDSLLSPFTAVASRYFAEGETARMVTGAEGVSFAAATSPGGIADIQFDRGAIWVTPLQGSPPMTVHARRDDGSVEAAAGRTLQGRTRVGDQDILGFGRFYLETGARPGTGRAVVYDPEAASRQSFAGLRWFPVTPAFQLPAAYTPIPNPDQITVGTSRGLQKEYFRVGTFTFQVDGQPARLVALAVSPVPKPGEELFIPFRDATTGRESYAVGRYLNVRFEGADARYTLDFNLVTNPYCAYSPHYNCVIPPRENTLAVAIRAGEMSYGKAH